MNMKESKSVETGFRIDTILLVESSFFRVSNVVFDNERVKNEINIDVGVSVKDKVITVAETVTLDQKFQDTDQVKIRVKMVGVFEVVGITEISDLKEFGRVNGAAIIFPYIREHITSQTLKAGIGAIMLPANFTR